MEQQTPIPPPLPQIKDEAARSANTRHFPILNLGGGGEGRSRFSIYFVQDCSAFLLDRMGFKNNAKPGYELLDEEGY